MDGIIIPPEANSHIIQKMIVSFYYLNDVYGVWGEIGPEIAIEVVGELIELEMGDVYSMEDEVMLELREKVVVDYQLQVVLC